MKDIFNFKKFVVEAKMKRFTRLVEGSENPYLEIPEDVIISTREGGIPEFTKEDLQESYIQHFLKGGITKRQGDIASDNKTPLRAPQLVIFYLITKGESKSISDWKEFLALPANTVRERLREFQFAMNGKQIGSYKVNQVPLYNFAIGVFNAMEPNDLIALAETEFTEENRELVEKIRDRESTKSSISTQKAAIKKKAEAQSIILDYQKNKSKFPNERMVILALSKIHNTTPEFVKTVLDDANLIKK